MVQPVRPPPLPSFRWAFHRHLLQGLQMDPPNLRKQNGLGWPSEFNIWGPYQWYNSIICSVLGWTRKTRFCLVMPGGLGEHAPCSWITCLCAESPHGRRNFTSPQVSCGLVFMVLEDRLQSTKGPNPMEVVNSNYQKKIKQHWIILFEWSPPADILSGMYSGIPSGILFGLPCGILFDIYSDILFDIYSNKLFGLGFGSLLANIPWHMF